MKKTIFLFATCIAMFTACNKVQQNATPPASQPSLATVANVDDGSTFTDIDEFLDYFDGLYETGDWAIISGNDDGTVTVGDVGNDPDQDPNARHSYEGTGKIKFANWCGDQLNAGKCLLAGKTGDTYWADIVPCP